jgi:uncharacterized RDD family membrane protein YckC
MDELIPDPDLAIPLLTGVEYAGFWRRFNAYGIDATIVWLIAMLLGSFILPTAAPTSSGDDMQQLSDLMTAAQSGQISGSLMEQVKGNLFGSMLGGSLFGADTKIMIVVSALYNILLGTSIWQGTFGKYWLGMKIVMLDGSKLTLQQSAFRHAATAISAVAWMVPCITVFFTKDKLAPHDMLCGTRVIMRT